jgi:hypothetical protein
MDQEDRDYDTLQSFPETSGENQVGIQEELKPLLSLECG